MLSKHIRSLSLILCISVLFPFEKARGADDIFLSGCSITIPEGFELVRKQDDHMEYTQFGFPNIVSIEKFKFSGEFLQEEFQGVPVEIVDTFEFDGIKATVFDTLGMKESLNVRHVLLANDNEVVLLTSFSQELFSKVFCSCLKGEHISQIIEKMGKLN
ncbi:hypothetical protein [Pseudoalteromonas piscicida]|uniref:hypothetical protein n=1 Tax=Pseudoalteromonas piscicida TaxID=43662 RepID=UPI00117A2C6D|nr:hypothetical protein [Pseudoalteromonas piscicida]